MEAVCQPGEAFEVVDYPCEAEEIYLASFDLAGLRANRQRKIWGDSFRRPSTYGDLLNPEAVEPFKRKDAFGRALDR